MEKEYCFGASTYAPSVTHSIAYDSSVSYFLRKYKEDMEAIEGNNEIVCRFPEKVTINRVEYSVMVYIRTYAGEVKHVRLTANPSFTAKAKVKAATMGLEKVALEGCIEALERAKQSARQELRESYIDRFTATANNANAIVEALSKREP